MWCIILWQYDLLPWPHHQSIINIQYLKTGGVLWSTDTTYTHMSSSDSRREIITHRYASHMSTCDEWWTPRTCLWRLVRRMDTDRRMCRRWRRCCAVGSAARIRATASGTIERPASTHMTLTESHWDSIACSTTITIFGRSCNCCITAECGGVFAGSTDMNLSKSLSSKSCRTTDAVSGRVCRETEDSESSWCASCGSMLYREESEDADSGSRTGCMSYCSAVWVMTASEISARVCAAADGSRWGHRVWNWAAAPAPARGWCRYIRYGDTMRVGCVLVRELTFERGDLTTSGTEFRYYFDYVRYQLRLLFFTRFVSIWSGCWINMWWILSERQWSYTTSASMISTFIYHTKGLHSMAIWSLVVATSMLHINLV